VTAQGEDILAWLDAAITRAEQAADNWHNRECEVHAVSITDTATILMAAEVPGAVCDCEGPATVLRRCAADRKLMKLHRPVILRAGGGAAYFETTTVCTSCEPPRQFPEHAVPCQTLVALAEGYGWNAEKTSAPAPAQTPPTDGDQVT
jgi:hypothetical protein